MKPRVSKNTFLRRFKRRMNRVLGISRGQLLKQQYAEKRRDFLIANPWCAWGLKQTPPQHIRSVEVHHVRGRVGKLLLDERYWLAVSHVAHGWIHNNIAAARKLGLICEKGYWGKQL